MSVRRLGVLVQELKADSSLSRALNDNRLPWTNTDHLIADLFKLWARTDHPTRAEAEAKARRETKQTKVQWMVRKAKAYIGIGG